MSKWLASFVAIALLIPSAYIGTANAADQGVRTRVSHASVRHDADRECGCCGCWYPEYVQHREIVYAYPSDPRYTLTSIPYYTPGHTYTYVHNW